MARLLSSPSPSPFDFFHYYFQPILSESPYCQLQRIQLCVFVTTLLLILQHVLGAIRPFVRVKYVASKIVYKLTPFAITFTMGLMHNASAVHVLYPVWACVLVYAYGGAVTMTACDISDNDNTLPYLCSTLPLFFWTFWLASIAIYNSTQSQMLALVITLLLFGVFALSNTMDTLDAFELASKSKGLPRFVEPIVQHMREGKDFVPSDEVDAGVPTSMRGYRYLVWRTDNNIITTEDIWRSLGTTFLVNCAGVERLKDTCLSFAFFRLILRRFADYPLHEISQPKTRRFIREGLLSNSRESAERVFSIIEVELHILFDFFYTKSRLYTSYNFRQGLVSMALMPLYYVAIQGIPILSPDSSSDGHVVGVTLLVIMLYLLVWVMNNVRGSFSDWNTVCHICLGLSKVGMDDKGARISEKLMASLFAVKDTYPWVTKILGNKPWQRKLGQYSFLESYHQVPTFSGKLFSPFARLVRLPRVGQVGDFNVPLSDQVKRAIVASLLPHVQDEARPLSRGTTTITRYGLSRYISINACELESSTDAQVILVWHIATSICESLSPPKNINDDNFLVATQLSKYCAYLLNFAPELLPGHPYTTQHFFDVAVQQAQGLSIQDSNVGEQYQDGIDVEAALAANNDNIVAQGDLLAQALIDQVMERNPDRGWNVLAEFWAELLLYLAPSDNVAAHGDYLARGGEFITHFWALLTHAGIVARPHPSS